MNMYRNPYLCLVLLLFFSVTQIQAQNPTAITTYNISPSGKYFAVGYENLKTEVYLRETGELIQTTPPVIDYAGSSIRQLLFSPDEAYLVIVFNLPFASYMYVQDIVTGTIYEYDPRGGTAREVSFTTNGNRLLVIADTSALVEITPSGVVELSSISIPNIGYGQISPSGVYAGLVGLEELFVYRTESWELIAIISLSDPYTPIFSWNHTNDKIAIVDADGLRIWDVETQTFSLNRPIGADVTKIRRIRWDLTNSVIVLSELDEISGWSSSTGEKLFSILASDGNLILHDFSPQNTIQYTNTGSAFNIAKMSELFEQNIDTFAPTLTPTAIQSMTATATSTFTPTPTSTFTPTATPTFTPTATHTPTASPTANAACTFNVAASDTAGLISAMVSANELSSPSVICLGGGTYALSAVHNNEIYSTAYPTIALRSNFYSCLHLAHLL
jgi:WD40 repeat protein